MRQQSWDSRVDVMARPELLLIRHGIAVERAPDCPDARRPLTPAGRSRTAAVLARLRALDLRCDRLLTSPLLRARQTAELAVVAGLCPAFEVAAGLAPEADPWPLLRCSDGVDRLALVGHEPDLGALAAALIGAPAGSLVLKKAGIALLVLDGSGPRPQGRLRLLMGPAQLLAGS